MAEEQDYKNVPLMNTESGKVLMPGVDVHANAIQQLLHQSYLKSPYKELHINSGNYLYHIALNIIYYSCYDYDCIRFRNLFEYIRNGLPSLILV